MGTADVSPRRESQRARVEQVALTLFRQHGFDNVTVEQISVEAQVAPATFYRYFGTKQGVLFAYHGQFMSAVRAVTRSASTGDRERDLVASLHGFADFLERSADMLALRDDIVSRNPALMAHTIAVQRQWEDELAAGLARSRGLNTPDLAARLDAAIGLVLIRVAFRRWRDESAGTLDGVLTAVLREADIAPILPGQQP